MTLTLKGLYNELVLLQMGGRVLLGLVQKAKLAEEGVLGEEHFSAKRISLTAQ